MIMMMVITTSKQLKDAECDLASSFFLRWSSGSNGWAWWSSGRWGQWVSMVIEWEVWAVGEHGGRVRSVSLINSYYHSREVRTSTTASTSCTGSMVSVRVSSVCVCVCVCELKCQCEHERASETVNADEVWTSVRAPFPIARLPL